MYTLIKTTTRFAVVALGLLLTACVTDVYEPKPEPEPTPTPIPGGGDFDFSTVEETTLTVNVNDQYNGQFDYIVEVYYENPFDVKDAECKFKGIASAKKTLTLNLVLPQALEEIYVMQKDPTQGRSVQIISVTGEAKAFTCDFRPAQTTGTKSTASSFATKGKDSDSNNDTPENATEITTENTGKQLVLKGVSVIPAGVTVQCNDLKLGKDSKLYVEGNLDISGTTQVEGKNTLIVVQKGGQIIGNASIIGNDKQILELVIKSGASIKLSQATLSNCMIKNGGYVEVKSIVYSNGHKQDNGNDDEDGDGMVSNTGVMNVGDFNLNQSELENEGKITISGTLTANPSAVIDNDCFMDINKFETKNAKVELDEMSLFKCGTIFSEGTSYDMDKNAILRATSVTFSNGNNKIEGEDDDDNDEGFALVDFENVTLSGNGNGNGKVLAFKKNLHVVMVNLNESEKYSIDDGAQRVDRNASIEIPAGGCSGEGNVVDKPEPGNPDYPIEIPNGGDYTFAMEDNWPSLGDYDMNDLVLGMNITLNSENDGITNMEMQITLRAVGATKTLGAGLQFENVSSDKITSVVNGNLPVNGYFNPDGNGVESSAKAVLPLFDNAHGILGVASGQITNTYKYDAGIKTLYYAVDFKSPVPQADLVITKLNFFIVNGGNADQRSEVHLAGYAPTAKVKGDTKNYLSEDGMVWGIMIPTVFQYPKEGTRITDAYNGFEAWSQSGGKSNADWYNSPTESGVLPIYENENVGK